MISPKAKITTWTISLHGAAGRQDFPASSPAEAAKIANFLLSAFGATTIPPFTSQDDFPFAAWLGDGRWIDGHSRTMLLV